MAAPRLHFLNQASCRLSKEFITANLPFCLGRQSYRNIFAAKSWKVIKQNFQENRPFKEDPVLCSFNPQNKLCIEKFITGIALR